MDPNCGRTVMKTAFKPATEDPYISHPRRRTSFPYIDIMSLPAVHRSRPSAGAHSSIADSCPTEARTLSAKGKDHLTGDDGASFGNTNQCRVNATASASRSANGPSSEGKPLYLFGRHFRIVEAGPLPNRFQCPRGSLSVLLHDLHQRVKTGVLMMLSFGAFLVAISGAAPGQCLVSRADNNGHQPLCASFTAERVYAAVQEPARPPIVPSGLYGRQRGRPDLNLKRSATRRCPLFIAPGNTAAATRGKMDEHSRKHMPALFLGALAVSSHNFSSVSNRDASHPTSAVAVLPGSVAAPHVSSPPAFAAALHGTSPKASPCTRLSALLLSSSSAESPTGAATRAAALATPDSSSTVAISLHKVRGSSSTSVPAPEFDVVIVGLGVGGHAAALHAAALGLRTAVVTGGDPGGTCVNRGCVPSKALLAIAKKVKSLRNKKLLAQMGIHLQGSRVEIDPAQVARHAKGVVEKVRGGLVRSLANHGITSFEARGILEGRADRVYLQPVSSSCSSSTSSDSLPQYITTRNVVLAPGSKPFVPRGVELDEQHHRIMTSDACVTLPWLPSSVCIVGAGYIGLEFMDVFSSLGSEVTLVDSGPRALPGVDAEIAKAAERLLLQQFKERPVTLHRNTLASSVKTLPSQQHKRTSGCSCSQPPLVEVQLMDVKTKGHTGTLYTDACLIATGRVPSTQNLGLESLGVTLKRGGFVPVDACMRVTRPHAGGAANAESAAMGDKQLGGEESQPVEAIDGLYCIGDANGQMMLAHAASAQGIAAVETIAGRPRVVNVKHIPAACFTSPEIAFVGDTEEAAVKEGESKGFEVGKSVSHFRANTKAVAEGEAEGLLKVLYRKDTGKLLGCHMIGMHASDLIQECATAIANDLNVKQLAFTTHTHPTLSEVVDAAWKKAVGMNAH